MMLYFKSVWGLLLPLYKTTIMLNETNSSTATKNIKTGPQLHMAFCQLGEAPTQYRLPLLRKLVASKIGQFNDWVHNHRLDGTGVLYRQARVHYYLDADGQFTVVGIQEGAEVVREWYSRGCPVNYRQTDLTWRTAHTTYLERSFQLAMEPSGLPRSYQLSQYFALNSNHWKQWGQLVRPAAQQAFLSNILNQHLHTFAKAYGWELPGSLNYAYVSDYQKRRPQKYENTKIITFDLTFYSSLLLPESIFLGKRTSLGFGRLHSLPYH